MRFLWFTLTVTLASAGVFAGPWNASNNPQKFSRMLGKPFTTQYTSLPLVATLSNSRFIWSDTYWPSQLGGIAYRWNSEPDAEPFRYKFLTKQEVKALALTELERLSPAEKYDIYQGRFDYPLSKRVLAKYSPRDLWWEGICHGWALAAIHHPEPQRVNLTSRDGIVVPFGSQDVKGLLDYYYAVEYKSKRYARIGNRCRVNGKVPGEAYPDDRIQTMPSERLANTAECADVNAGAFHVVLTNMIGIYDQGFVAEVDRFNDVWNQPVGSYAGSVVGERAPTPREARSGVAKVLYIKMAMTYGEELNLLGPSYAGESGGFLSMDPVTGTDQQTFATRHYEYTLELDASERIIGGEWISVTRPDFIWIRGAAERFSGRLSLLNEIYQPLAE